MSTPAPNEAQAGDAVQAPRRFLDALERHDFAALRSCFADDLWFRALLPKKLVEASTGDETAAVYAAWFAEASDVQWVDSEHRALPGREHLRYRWRLKPDWAAEQWHVVEQSGYCMVQDDRIRRLDIVCTGVHAF